MYFSLLRYVKTDPPGIYPVTSIISELNKDFKAKKIWSFISIFFAFYNNNNNNNIIIIY